MASAMVEERIPDPRSQRLTYGSSTPPGEWTAHSGPARPTALTAASRPTAMATRTSNHLKVIDRVLATPLLDRTGRLHFHHRRLLGLQHQLNSTHVNLTSSPGRRGRILERSYVLQAARGHHFPRMAGSTTPFQPATSQRRSRRRTTSINRSMCSQDQHREYPHQNQDMSPITLLPDL